MDDKCAAGRVPHQMADKICQRRVFGLAVDADAVFDGYGGVGRGVLHGVQAVGHQRRVQHQACAECAFLHAGAGAAAVQVDFVIAVFGGFAGSLRQEVRFAAAQLQGDGVFAFVARQKAVRVAEHNRACVHHFGIKPGMAGDLPRHVAVVAVGPI